MRNVQMVTFALSNTCCLHHSRSNIWKLISEAYQISPMLDPGIKAKPPGIGKPTVDPALTPSVHPDPDSPNYQQDVQVPAFGCAHPSSYAAERRQR